MKKTLITLAALAVSSVAVANTVSPELQDDLASGLADMTVSVTNSGFTLNSTENSIEYYRLKDAPATSDSYTWIAVLSQDAVTNILGNWSDRSRIYATDNLNADAALGVEIFKNEDNSLAVQFKEHRTDVHYDPADGVVSGLTISSPDPNSIVLYGVQTNTGTKYVMSFSYDDSTKTYTFGALTADNTLGTVTFQKESTWDKSPYNGVDITNDAADAVEHFMWFDRALTTNEIAAIATYVIPEPTTATLSLLALAGLAARRRRK